MDNKRPSLMTFKRKWKPYLRKRLYGSSSFSDPFFLSLEPRSAAWPESSSHPTRSASDQFGTVCHESTFPSDQLAMLFDVVQEQSDLETTRLYQTTPVHSTHSESDTLAYLPCVRIPDNKSSVPSSKSIPEVRDSFTTKAPTTSAQSVPGYRKGFQSDSTMRVRDSPLRMDTIQTVSPQPNPYMMDELRWQYGLSDAYDKERHQTKSVEPKPHRICIPANSTTSPNVQLGFGGSVSGSIQHKGRTQSWRGPAVAQLLATGSGQKPIIATERSSSGSRWTTESQWSPIDSHRLGYSTSNNFRRGIRSVRPSTFREAFTGLFEDHCLEKRRGDSGRVSRTFGFKTADRRGRLERGTFPNRFAENSKAALSRTNDIGYENQEIDRCFPYLAERRKNIWSHSKPSDLIPKYSRAQRRRDSEELVHIMTEHAQLLHSAERGLSELSQHSSDEDGDELSYQCSLPSTLAAPFSPYDSQQEHTSSDSQQSTSSHHTYTMDSAGDMMKRLSELSKQDGSNAQLDSACSLSNSGSITSDAEKSNGLGTYHRPRIPTALVRNPNARVGKIVPIQSKMNSQPHVTNGHNEEEFLVETQKLVAQLEQRMMTNGSPVLNGETKRGNIEMHLTGEDQEVAEAFLNSAQNAGINRRLLAALQRRQPHLQSPDTGRRTSTDLIPEEDVPRRQNNPSRRLGGTISSARPRSQQPTSRLTLYNIESEQHKRGSSSTRTGSTPRVARYVYPEVNSQSNSHRLNVRQSPLEFRDGWDSNKQHQLPGKSASLASPRLHHSSQDSAKLSALMNWQRRKAYDPRTAIALNGTRATGRSSALSMRDDDQLISSSTDEGKRAPQSRGQRAIQNSRIFVRNKNTDRRTAPVETSDCIAALERIHPLNSTKGFPAHCSVVSALAHPNGLNRTGAANLDATGRRIPKYSRPETELTDRKKRSPRASSVHSGVGESASKRESRMTTKAAGRTTATIHHGSTVNGRVNAARCLSQTGYRVDAQSRQNRDMGVDTTDAETRTDHQLIANDRNYPDIAVESIRYKIEKLTDFIVRMRKRIERDYAEQGTCSPGDDMFGDEAVGATVAGRPTGMHPVVASSLKNLRVLEVNAQEIFSLLYPTEVDLWEPARACLAGDIGDEKLFNEARSKLTEHIVNILQEDESAKANATTPNRLVTSDTQSPLISTDPNFASLPKNTPNEAGSSQEKADKQS